MCTYCDRKAHAKSRKRDACLVLASEDNGQPYLPSRVSAIDRVQVLVVAIRTE